MDTSWEKTNTGQIHNILNKTIYVHKGINNLSIENIVCVLAGGLNINSEPHYFVKKRLDKSIEIFNKNPSNTVILVLGGGTYHKPPNLNDDQYVIHESTSCALYLNNHDIPSSNIFREWSSYDTIANGFFAFTNYINYISLKNIYVITSTFHMPRTKTIFNYFNKLFNKYLDIIYLDVSSELDSHTLSERCKRERNSKKNFIENVINKIHTPEKFIQWFFTEHKAYSSIVKYVKNNEINKKY